MVKLHVKKGDTVVVVSGKDKGKVGEILSVDKKEMRVLVKDVNIVKRHLKPSATSAGGVVSSERSIHVSNVMHVDPKTKAPTRVGFQILEDGRKVRVAKKSGEQIDN
ncbi:MAG: 50S ribosomal protein L24 [Candidatus Puniceispirillum sp.]|nr:50S ribosomal protein L24 [Candidatus Puniceispirillum sp.]